MDQPQYTPKREKLEKMRKDAEQLRSQRHGWYNEVKKKHPEFLADLMKFIDATYQSHLNSSLKSSGIIDNEPRSLTSEQRTSLLDKADGISIIKAYIESNLS